MVFSLLVKQPIRCYEERLRPDETLVTKLRSIDTFLPVAKGGTFCVPYSSAQARPFCSTWRPRTPMWTSSSWSLRRAGPARWWRC